MILLKKINKLFVLLLLVLIPLFSCLSTQEKNSDKEKRTKAIQLMNQANDAFNNAEAKNAWDLYKNRMEKAKEDLDSGNTLLSKKQYDESMKYAQNVLKIVGSFSYKTTSNQVFPKYYRVRYDRSYRDCFWKIAEFDFVYNSPLYWIDLYRANKKKLQSPSNPSLISPGLLIEIPSINGETREGVYDPKKKYPKFNPYKKY
jgi:nucleoid-associated protein YgaU